MTNIPENSPFSRLATKRLSRLRHIVLRGSSTACVSDALYRVLFQFHLIMNSFLTANRETAYLHSIRASAITYALTRDCRKGNFKNCNCLQDRANSAQDWSGCHDNVKFGDVLCKHFLDSLETGKPKKRAQINLHNNAVGRKVS